eukprot:GHVS01096820.1.p1 GENE.GHVS01096820.1~~GHVS01096820.1.p1  ORF type:complete len:865 (-),score=130.72 GHVS01096820.1:71-2665(-)
MLSSRTTTDSLSLRTVFFSQQKQQPVVTTNQTINNLRWKKVSFVYSVFLIFLLSSFGIIIFLLPSTIALSYHPISYCKRSLTIRPTSYPTCSTTGTTTGTIGTVMGSLSPCLTRIVSRCNISCSSAYVPLVATVTPLTSPPTSSTLSPVHRSSPTHLISPDHGSDHAGRRRFLSCIPSLPSSINKRCPATVLSSSSSSRLPVSPSVALSSSALHAITTATPSLPPVPESVTYRSPNSSSLRPLVSCGSSSPSLLLSSSSFLRDSRLSLRTDATIDPEKSEMANSFQLEGTHLGHFPPLPPGMGVSPHPPCSSIPAVSGPTVLEPTASLSLKDVFTSVVKVFTDYTDPNFAQPWQMRRQMKSTGSGFVIADRRIMTNAHCVAFQNRVLVRKHGSPKKYLARVMSVAHESDLAVLTVEEDEFWEGVAPLSFGDIPHLQDAVVVVGYPTGGDNLSITAGVVSRVDINTYAHSNFRLLCAQIDAAINPGNSGGPAFKDGKVVGVAFQGYDDAQNIGYIVPTPVIEHFLNDLKKNNKYTGFVTLGITYQPMENCSLRKFLGIDDVDTKTLPEGVGATGILVIQSDELRDKQHISKMKKEHNIDLSPDTVGVRKNDVILAMDGINVADDGTIFFRNQERVHLAYAISHKYTGDTVEVTVLRNKKVTTVTVPLTAPNFLVPEHQWDKKPRYYIYGGLVFCPMSLDYLKDEFGKKFYERAPSTLLKPLTDIFAKHAGEESIILSQILASDLTIGYDLRNIRLIAVNGEKIVNLKHLSQILDTIEKAETESSANVVEELKSPPLETQGSCAAESLTPESPPAGDSKALPTDGRFVIFEFEHELQLVLDRKQAAAMQEGILRHHAISRYRSEEI